MNKITSFWHQQCARILTALLILLAVGSTLTALQQIQTQRQLLRAKNELANVQHQSLLTVAGALAKLKATIAAYKAEGVDVSSIEQQLPTMSEQLFQQNAAMAAAAAIEQATAQLEQLRNQKLAADQAAAELAAKQGALGGTITGENAAALSAATVTLSTGNVEAAKATTNTQGQYSLTTSAGKYTLTASRSGYVTIKKYDVEIKAKQTLKLDLQLTKVVAAPPPSSGGGATANSSYERKTITTNRGSFLVDLITINLASGGIKVKTDTANDEDCSDNCAAKPLSSFVSSNSGFAGINGTYFCPPDYAACAGKTNTFFWKVKNTRLDRMINATNGLGENEPFMTFSSSGTATYYSKWRDAPTSVYAGINCGPRLIEGGANVLTDSSMDEKQRTTRSNRGALGLKGQTLYALIAKSATVPDVASILMSLGVDSALNLDGGGSSTMYYNSSYKTGPGRSLPNAIVFTGG